MCDYIESVEIKKENICLYNGSFKISKIPGGSEKDTYKAVMPRYNYGTPENKKLGDINIQLKKCRIRVRREEDFKNNKVNWKTTIRLEDKDEIKGLKNLDLGNLQCLLALKEKLGLDPRFSVEEPGKEYKHVCFRMEKDPKDGTPLQDPLDLMVLKIDGRSQFAYVESFTNGKLTPKVISYEELEGQEIECQIVMQQRYIYCGSAGCIPQIFINNCLILNYYPGGKTVDQLSSAVVQEFFNNNPDIETLKDKLKIMKENVAKQRETRMSGTVFPASAPNIGTHNNYQPKTITDHNNFPPIPSSQPSFDQFRGQSPMVNPQSPGSYGMIYGSHTQYPLQNNTPHRM